jgi:tetraacyldisaccharide 4'-kinase
MRHRFESLQIFKVDEYMARSPDEVITNAWYSGAKWLYLLWPFSLLYRLIITLRRAGYARGLFKVYRSALPVIVVGNITVGGTGKSPLVCYLVDALRAKGFTPGIVSRGYGANLGKTQVREVYEHSLPAEVGDEPLMLKRRLGCPVFVSPSRRAAAQALEKTACDIIISDDGLQHYALARDIEICVFDGKRKWGNGQLLPMGPLREPITRIHRIPFLVINGAENARSYGQAALAQKSFSMRLQADKLIRLHDGSEKVLTDLKGETLHAVAAIGNPERFFNTLEQAGITPLKHAFPDHHAYQPADLQFAGDAQATGEPLIIMTEKDAVKCRAFNLENLWYLPVSACLNGDLAGQIINTLNKQ